jgi:hypothetical protein
MFVRTLAVTLVPVTLAGCASQAEIAQRNAIEDDAKCQSYGAKPGEPAYATCRATLNAAHTEARAIANSGGGAAAPGLRQYPAISYPAAPTRGGSDRMVTGRKQGRATALPTYATLAVALTLQGWRSGSAVRQESHVTKESPEAARLDSQAPSHI